MSHEKAAVSSIRPSLPYLASLWPRSAAYLVACGRTCWWIVCTTFQYQSHESSSTSQHSCGRVSLTGRGCPPWSYRWHQLLRHVFIVFGSRPGRALFGKPGAFMGAFTVSAMFHHLSIWGIWNGSESLTSGGFFILIGAGAVIELAFAKATGSRVRGWVDGSVSYGRYCGLVCGVHSCSMNGLDMDGLPLKISHLDSDLGKWSSTPSSHWQASDDRMTFS